MEFQTERLILRSWKESDAESLFKYACNPSVGPSAGWPVHKSIEESLGVIKNVLCGKECFAVCLRSDDMPIGCVELILNDASDSAGNSDECELGFWLAQPFWGQSIMSEAAGRLILHAFEDLHMKKIWCRYYEGNEKSEKIQHRLGFDFVESCKNVEVPLLKERRTVYKNCLTREKWEMRRNFSIALMSLLGSAEAFAGIAV